jgi:predicted anti-sigma-YlaC factor YlaD
MTTAQQTEIIVQLLQTILWPAIAALSVWLYHKLKAALPQNQQAVLDRIVQHAVQYVMQKFGDKSPEEKRKEAEKAIYALADFFKYKGLDPVVVNTILESIVWETKQTKIDPAATLDATSTKTA